MHQKKRLRVHGNDRPGQAPRRVRRQDPYALSKETNFLNDKEKMLATLRKEAVRSSSGNEEELRQLDLAERKLQARPDTLIDMMEGHLIDQEDFRKRYQKRRTWLITGLSRRGSRKSPFIQKPHWML